MKERIKIGTKILSLLLVFSLVISILPIQASAGNETQVTEQTYGEWSDVVPVNGNFEVGVEGMDVYGWSITSTTNNAQINTSDDWTPSFSLKTEGENGNKVASFSKEGTGYAAMTSQKITVASKQTYRLSYKYRTSEKSEAGNFDGIQVAVRQLDANEQDTSHTVLNANNTKGTTVMDAWEETVYDFVVDDNASQIILYFEMSGSYDNRVTVLFDDISLTAYEYAEVPNGKFDGVSLLADGARVAGVEGPSGWTMVSCTASGVPDAGGNEKYYMATTEKVDGDTALKLAAKDNTTYYQSKIQSQLIPVTENTSYTINYDLKIQGSTTQSWVDDQGVTQNRYQHTKIVVDYYDAEGTYISSVVGSTISTTNELWKTNTYSGTIVSGASYIKIGFYIAGTHGKTAEFAYYYDNVSLSLMGSAAQSLNGWTVDRQQFFISTSLDFKNIINVDRTSSYKISYIADQRANSDSTVIKFTRLNSWDFADLASDKYIIEAGKEYQVSFDYKMTDYKEGTTKSNAIVYALRPFIRTYGSANQNTGVFLMSQDANAVIMQKDAEGNDVIRNTGDSEWITVTYRFTAPENAVSCKLFFGVAGYDLMFSCNYWFDNVTFKEIDEKVDETDLLFKMLEGGYATDDEIVDVCDLVRMKRKLTDKEDAVAINDSADMNINSKYDADDIKLLCWKLIGITKTEEIETP